MKIHRPMINRLQVQCRKYSRPLQRAITDFGADSSFQEAAGKMKEHYGLEVPRSMIRKITEKHAESISDWKSKEKIEATDLLIAEMDGSMVPIVELEKKKKGIDVRKTRKVCWKEAKLCFARSQNKINRVYGVIIGSPEEAGMKLYECAQKVGLTEKTYVHGLGDGAQWIVEQFEERFGSQTHFLIDFFHTCEYLSGASVWCDPLDPKGWLKKNKETLKEGGCSKILKELKMKINELEKIPDDSGIAKCVRYMEKRIKYMDYGKAKEKELPIGSGEVESSHRHIIQKRLKISGAWWKIENANAMLQLRVARANGYWTDYWNKKKAA